MKITATELRKNPDVVLEALEQNETVVLTRNGKEIGTFTPSRSGEEWSVESSGAFGMWKDREDMQDPVAWVNKLRTPRFRGV